MFYLTSYTICNSVLFLDRTDRHRADGTDLNTIILGLQCHMPDNHHIMILTRTDTTTLQVNFCLFSCKTNTLEIKYQIKRKLNDVVYI